LIVNRWGDVVYTLTNQTGTAIWNAKTTQGEACTDGVYFYKLKGQMLGGTDVEEAGFMTVIGSK